MSAQTTPSAPVSQDAPLGVLVGVDGSDQSISAARWAQREARLRGDVLTLATAYTVPVFWGASLDGGIALADGDRLRAGVDALLREVAGTLDPEGVAPELRAEVGDAAGVLVDLSAQASLLVSGSRGRGGFLGRLLGSVSSALPGHAHCPVAIIPAGVEESRAADGVPVVAGVDGSEEGRAAALVAAEEAAARTAPLHLVCALPPVSANAAWLAVSLDEEARRRELQERLDAGVAWLTSEFPDLQVTTELVEGNPVDVMVEQTATARLTVLGTRGLGGFSGALVGSTSQGVAHHAKGPVMVVPFREDVRLGSRGEFGPVASQGPRER